MKRAGKKKMAWFTPMSEKTGISRYSIAAVKALSEDFDVEVWTEKRGDDLLIDARVVDMPKRPSAGALDGYSAVVYNLGNNPEFHASIYEWYKMAKGVVVLHDKLMHDFFAYLYIIRKARPGAYLSMMRHYYGEKAEPYARGVLQRAQAVEALPEFHLLDQCVWNASGVVVHSKGSLELVRGISAAPSSLIYFPFEFAFSAAHSREELGLPEGKKIILQYGHITPNKHAHSVLEAMASDEALRQRAVFVLAGDCASGYGDRIREMIRSLGLEGSVLLTGYLDDARLQSLLCHSDVCVNLRYPSAEGASGSLVEQMFAGKAIIAAKAGFFDEMPDECILKIAYPFDAGKLAGLIRKAVLDEPFNSALATRAQRFAQANFKASNYRDGFKELLSEVERCSGALGKIDMAADSAVAYIGETGPEKAAERALAEAAAAR